MKVLDLGVNPSVDLQITAQEFQRVDTLVDGQKGTITKRLPERTLHRTHFALKKSESKALENGLKDFALSYRGPQEDGGFDGVTVRLLLEYDDKTDSVQFWSPRRKAQGEYYNVIDPLFSILNQHAKSQSEIRYVEGLQEYFDFGIPIKVTFEQPLTYRIYGTIYGDKDMTSGLQLFVSQFPSDKKVIVDLTNGSVAPVYYSRFFGALTEKNKMIEWRVTEEGAKDLDAAGVNGNIKVVTLEYDW